MKKPFKVKIFFEGHFDDVKVRFVRVLKLPFVPTKDTVILPSGGVVRVGPFTKVLWDEEHNSFAATMEPYTMKNASELERFNYNLEAEGWKKVD
jgi:hypothetical protein